MTQREDYEARLAEIMPLFVEARDALTAISIANAKLHKVDLSLAARMDAVGTKDWRANSAQPAQPSRAIEVIVWLLRVHEGHTLEDARKIAAAMLKQSNEFLPEKENV